MQPHPVADLSPEALANPDYFKGEFFIEDKNVSIKEGLLNAANFLEKDMTLKQDVSAPQILIYHSHSQEAFIDSREGKVEDTIVGVGDYLKSILEEKYGYHVMHVKEEFPNISLGTVYRNLNLLTDLGEAVKITTPDGGDRFDGDVRPHNHFFCTCCKRVLDINMDMQNVTELNEIAAKDFDGIIDFCTMTFYGKCGNCIKKS